MHKIILIIIFTLLFAIVLLFTNASCSNEKVCKSITYESCLVYFSCSRHCKVYNDVKPYKICYAECNKDKGANAINFCKKNWCY